MENSDVDYGEDDINIMKEELRGILWTEDDPTVSIKDLDARAVLQFVPCIFISGTYGVEE